MTRTSLPRGIATMVAVGMLCLIASQPGNAGPLQGARSKNVTIDGNANFEQTLTFKGGQRACLMGMGPKDGEGFFQVAVYDAKKNLVASMQDTHGQAVVFWYPPTEGSYKVQVRNISSVPKDIYITIK